MAKCSNCGKTTSFGHNRSFSQHATNREWKPNLQKVTVLKQGRLVKSSNTAMFMADDDVLLRSLRGLATSTSCPSSVSSRLTHGECVPTSITTRIRFFPSNHRVSPACVVCTRPSSTIVPPSSSDAHVARPVSQVQTHDLSAEPARLRSTRPRHGATLLHGRSPLRASRPLLLAADSFGLRRETGLLIPSRYARR